MKELVSIITPARNAGCYLPLTIESAQAQTHQNWEMLICDDGSTDETLAVIEEYAREDSRVRLAGRLDGEGPAVARNTSLEAASGRFIAFLDSDDLWLPEKLERQLAFMRRTSCVFSYTAYRKIDAEGRQIGGDVSVPAEVDYRKLLRGPVIACLTAMYDSGQLGKIPMPLVRKRQDFGLWLRILRQVEHAYGLQECLAMYRVRRGSLSSDKFSAARYVWKVYREVERLPLLTSIASFIGYTACGIRKSLNR